MDDKELKERFYWLERTDRDFEDRLRKLEAARTADRPDAGWRQSRDIVDERLRELEIKQGTARASVLGIGQAIGWLVTALLVLSQLWATFVK